MEKILEVKDLEISFQSYKGEIQAVRGVSFELAKGETLAIVGESGSGKSVTSKGIMRLLPHPFGRIKNGKLLLSGEDLTERSDKQMRDIRGAEISMIFQDPMTSLNPTMTVGSQLMEGLMQHRKLGKSEAAEIALELLRQVGVPNPQVRMKQYPHQFSGGMRQRVVIAIALACNPKVLIADEPTTALDVTIQAQILDLLKELQREKGTSIILITHDLGVVANIAHRVAVMYAGQIVETGTADEIFVDPKHPYTWGLLASMPKIHELTESLLSIPGTPPDLIRMPAGCAFAARCPYVMEVCRALSPRTKVITETHQAACWLLDERAPRIQPPQGARP
ncbi:peptide ABC transporter ATP-binding protein [Paenibacillus elgii]|uniref:Peptide ABC transporter ATP-binding protein n=1 Tax=Paenibacillus elgii TaxID=189691 RepID=A0A163YR03_9BACL|nr:ABC transporter ATP-binding protein [Paenibacillus elgii]KZE80088.1 peptide ABC transporter ATP-binding protein [Paenibacillus elgii]